MAHRSPRGPKRVAVIVPTAGIGRIELRRALERSQRIFRLFGIGVSDAEIVRCASVTGRERQYAFQVGDRRAKIRQILVRPSAELQRRNPIFRRELLLREQRIGRKSGARCVARSETGFDHRERFVHGSVKAASADAIT